MAGKNSAHSVAYARRQRAKLITWLGGSCLRCHAVESLEFHHTHIRTWVANRLSRWQRMRKYWAEAIRGSIILLCSTCNKTEPTWGRRYKLTNVHAQSPD